MQANQEETINSYIPTINNALPTVLKENKETMIEIEKRVVYLLNLPLKETESLLHKIKDNIKSDLLLPLFPSYKVHNNTN